MLHLTSISRPLTPGAGAGLPIRRGPPHRKGCRVRAARTVFPVRGLLDERRAKRPPLPRRECCVCSAAFGLRVDCLPHLTMSIAFLTQRAYCLALVPTTLCSLARPSAPAATAFCQRILPPHQGSMRATDTMVSMAIAIAVRRTHIPSFFRGDSPTSPPRHLASSFVFSSIQSKVFLYCRAAATFQD